MALENNLEILPVINKIDLPHADPEKVKKEVEDVIGLDASEAPLVSGKSGIGVDVLLEEIVKKIPSPTGKAENPLQALIFDSWFDPYRGVVVLARIMEGKVSVKDKITFKFSDQDYEIIKLAVNCPFYLEVDSLAAGEVGMFICGIKTVRDVKIGDTIIKQELIRNGKPILL
jgi:GTP-binding protein LepA